MKKYIFIKSLLLLVCLICFCLSKNMAKAEEQNDWNDIVEAETHNDWIKWNRTETATVTENGVTYDVYFSNDRTECWIYKVTMPEGSTMLKFPKTLQNATVTKLGCNYESNYTVNIFGQWVEEDDEYGSVVYNSYQKCRYPIKKVSIPDTVTKITSGTFGFFTQLKSVRLPENLKAVIHCTFYQCDNLEKIVFPKNMMMVASRAFLKSKRIKKISLSKKNRTYKVQDNYLINRKTKEIEFFATAKKEIKLPKEVTVMGQAVAVCAMNATSLYIPKSVTRIEDGALDMRTSLKKITVQKGNKKYAVHDNCIYRKKDKSLVAVIVKGGKVKVSSKVRSISDKIDVIGKNIKTVHIPASVKRVYPDWSWELSGRSYEPHYYFYGKKPPKAKEIEDMGASKIYVPKKWKKNYKNYFCGFYTFNPKK